MLPFVYIAQALDTPELPGKGHPASPTAPVFLVIYHGVAELEKVLATCPESTAF
jgi:hypothetical protein